MSMYDGILERAARVIASADALLIGAGAGMGVDSGLPDFRGVNGFWKDYPPFRGKQYKEIATPHLMRSDPELAWGFYSHCMQLFRNTQPHQGFSMLKKWAETIVPEHFIFTSNIDEHFQRSGFADEKIFECHGSTYFLQCERGLECGTDLWPVRKIVKVSEETLRATGTLPRCRNCASLARPNTLMFGDYAWVPMRSVEQEKRLNAWQESLKGANIVAIEFGAGPTVPTVRYECSKRSQKLIRVNPTDYIASPDSISVPMGALEAIKEIDKRLH
ncbi:MAG: NAD-dependent protein deacetylase [Cyanobacteria bacterium HKST-UBA02]|nr:NAD-dependent protein deacetylase [Cyanobacteria bacterium HKST-UBA02]